MQPAAKRRRLDEPLPDLGNADPDDDEAGEWEEYDGDDDTEAAILESQEGCADQDNGYQIAIKKAYADDQFRATMDHIFKKYGRDFDGIGDEIDLDTGTIVVNNGHIENMRDEVDVGIPGEDTRLMETQRQKHTEQGGDSDSNMSDEDEALDERTNDAERGEQDDGEAVLFREVGETELYHPYELGEGAPFFYANDQPQWAHDDEEQDATPNYMQLQGSYPDPDNLDIITGYGRSAVGPEGSTLMPGLYDGGALHYASTQSAFGASPFALGPWEMLPLSHKGHHFPGQNAQKCVDASGHRFRDDAPDEHSSMKGPSQLSGSGLGAEKLTDMDSEKIHGTTGAVEQSANFFEQFPEQATAFCVNATEKQSFGQSALDARGVCTSKTTASCGTTAEDSETTEDPVFSAEDMDVSSQTGDEVAKPASTLDARRMIPDSQNNSAPQDDAPDETAADAARHYRHQMQQHFDLACMLSDDEAPISCPSTSATNASLYSKKLQSLLRPDDMRDRTRNVDSDSTVKRGRGRPRKHARQGSDDVPLRPRAPKKKSTSYPHTHTHVLPSKPATNVSSREPRDGAPGPQASRATDVTEPPKASIDRAEAVPAVKKKRGRPRKHPLPESTNPQPRKAGTEQPTAAQPSRPNNKHCPFPMPGQPFFYASFPHVFPSHSLQYPVPTAMPHPAFHQGFQQPFLPVPQLHQPFSYPNWQSPYFHQPFAQLQRPAVQGADQQQTQQPLLSLNGNGGVGLDQQPIKRKRGRPRKYPVGYKRSRARVKLPALQNSMTALLSGNQNRTMVSEDAWYGVARRLAADISCLQGGYFFGGGMQGQTMTYVSPRMNSHSSPTTLKDKAPSSSSQPKSPQSAPCDNSRIIEVLSNAAVSPARRLECGASSEDSDSTTTSATDSATDSEVDSVIEVDDDDEGMAFVQSPSPPTNIVDLPSSPSKSPASSRSSSPLTQSERSSASPGPGPVQPPNRQSCSPFGTPETKKRLLPGADAFDLPTSPVSVKKYPQSSPHITASGKRRTHLSSLECRATFDPDPNKEAFNDDAALGLSSRRSSLIRKSPKGLSDAEWPNAPEVRILKEEADVLDVSHEHLPVKSPARVANTITVSPSREAVVAEVEVIHNRNLQRSSPDQLPSPKPVEEDCDHASAEVEPPALPDSVSVCQPVHLAHKASSQRSKGHANEVSTRPLLAKTPPNKLSARSPNVPRSAERCTPIFVEVPPISKKLPIIKERRTMGEIKQAMMAPKKQTRTSESATSKITLRVPAPSRLKVLHQSEQLSERDASVKSSATTRDAIGSSTHRASSKASQTLPHGAQKANSRKWLSSLTRQSRDKEDDDDYEIGSSVHAKSLSSKPARPFISSRIVRDSERKLGTSGPLSAESSVKPEKSRAKSKKKRRHTDGSVARRAGSAASTDGRVCGVDGYTCDRDFCFTCL